MGKFIFAEEAPEIEIRDGLAFVVHKNGRSVAISVSNLQDFIRRANVAIQDWRCEQFGKVEQIAHWRSHPS